MVLYLLGGQLHEILVDDIADVLQIDREGDDAHRTSTALLVETFARDLGHVELDGFVKAIHRVVHFSISENQLAVVKVSVSLLTVERSSQ